MKTQTAQVTVQEQVIDSFSVELTLITDLHAYEIAASWSAWDGWDATITDEFGYKHDADILAVALDYSNRQDMMTTLTENICLDGPRDFSVIVKAGA